MKNFFPKVAFYLYETLQGKNTISLYKHFLRTQWYTKKELEEYQFYKLKSLLEHAYKNVPYYTKLFNQYEFNPLKMNSLMEFKKIPCLVKKNVRGNIDKFIATNTNKKMLRRAKTGGSTGEPLVLYLCGRRRAADTAAGLRKQTCWGVDICDSRARLLGVPMESSFKERVNSLLTSLMNVKVLSPFNMSKENMARYVEVIKKSKPRMIFGYTNAIYMLAKFIKDNRIDLGRISFKVIVTTGEPLFAFQKEIIAGVFHCPVTNDYGVMEGGSIAMECPQGNLHILSDNVFLELINDDRETLPGEEGEVVVTNLYNYGMPLIRYKLGDMAILSDEYCDCGRSYPIIKNLIGRKTDFIALPGDRLIHGAAFIIILSGYEGVELFKVVQREAGRLVIMIEKNEHFSSGTIDIMKEEIDKLCEGKLKLDFIVTDKIDSIYKGAKYKYIVSDIAGQYFS